MSDTSLQKLYNDKSIDFIEMGKTIFNSKCSPKYFAKPILYLADDVVKKYSTLEELGGYHDCIVSMIKRMRWYRGIGRIPIYKKSFLYFMPNEREQAELIANSVILTTYKYRYSLDEHETNLRYILLGDFLNGLEWSFEIACSEGLFSRNDLPLIDLKDIEVFKRK